MKAKILIILGFLPTLAVFLGPSYYAYKLVKENYSSRKKIVFQKDLNNKKDNLIFIEKQFKTIHEKVYPLKVKS